ncbi:MAG: VanZ family protein [Planctomycetota bacterium]
MRRLASLWGPPLLWAAVILFLGTRPADQLPSGGLWALPGLDKALHACVYGVLGFLVVRATRPGRAGSALLLGAAIGLAWGGLDEWVQQSVPGRAAEPADWLADLLGAAAGAWIAFRTGRSRKRSEGGPRV